MHKETEAMVGSVLWDGDGKLATLLSAPYTFVNASLAGNIYGMKNVTGDALMRVDLNPAERAGLLTQPSFLARLNSRKASVATETSASSRWRKKKLRLPCASFAGRASAALTYSTIRFEVTRTWR